MPTPRKKIGLIILGGTVLSEEKTDKNAVTVKGDIKPWLAKMPEINIMAEIEPIFILGEKDNEPDLSHWTKLGKIIADRIDEFDGFVVTHHVHSLLAAACALSFMLLNVSKPVVFTGSQIPYMLAKKKTDKKILKKYKGLGIKANLINALQIAIQGPAEVSIMFGNKLVRANQAHITKSLSLNLFDAPLKAVLATIDFGIKISEHAHTGDKDALKFSANFDDNVSVVDFNSEQNADYLKWVLEKKPNGIIIQTHNPESALALLDNLIPVSYDMPILIHTDIPYSHSASASYIFIDNMTFEATVMKLKWALGQTNNRKKIAVLMKENIASELLEGEE
ncbi:MAG: asparaginase domain-containing protein [Patescibacteria group bacterium]|jgi:L-asparaginase